MVGCTPLHLAARCGDTECLKLLIEHNGTNTLIISKKP